MGHERDIVEKGFEQDRLDYWAMRDELLAKYAGKWVAVHKGRVTAVADEPLSIMEQALAEDGYAYTNKVGEEDKIVIRQRRVSFRYDDSYSPTPLPRVAAVLRNFSQTKSKTVTDAIHKRRCDLSSNGRLPRPRSFSLSFLHGRLPSFFRSEALGDILWSKSRGRR